MTAAEVLAPLVLVKNRDGEICYHYAGSVIPWLSDDDFARLTDEGMVRAAAAHVAAQADVPATTADPVDVPRPAKAHAKELWVEYAVSQGWDRGRAESMKKVDLVAALTSDEDEDEDDEPAESVDEPAEIVAPPKAGLLEDWQAYARAKGLPDEDIEGLDKQELIELLT